MYFYTEQVISDTGRPRNTIPEAPRYHMKFLREAHTAHPQSTQGKASYSNPTTAMTTALCTVSKAILEHLLHGPVNTMESPFLRNLLREYRQAKISKEKQQLFGYVPCAICFSGSIFEGMNGQAARADTTTQKTNCRNLSGSKVFFNLLFRKGTTRFLVMYLFIFK